MLGFILFLLVIGIIAGFLARAIVLGSDRRLLAARWCSHHGSPSVIGYVLFNEDVGEGSLQPSGIIGSVIGSIIAQLVCRARQRPVDRPDALSRPLSHASSQLSSSMT
jgi:uncharacterized membrane protein YeaQ/YmgE (transglycosylase-associated protein family)